MLLRTTCGSIRPVLSTTRRSSLRGTLAIPRTTFAVLRPIPDGPCVPWSTGNPPPHTLTLDAGRGRAGRPPAEERAPRLCAGAEGWTCDGSRVRSASWFRSGCSSPARRARRRPGLGRRRRLRMLAGQPMTPCLVQGEIPVKAEVAGLCGTLGCPRTGRTRTVAGSACASRSSRRSPRSRDPTPSSPSPAARATRARQFFAWLPGHYAGVHATHDIVLVDQRGTGASNALTLPPHARHVRADGEPTPTRGCRPGCATASRHSMPTRASTRARSRPTTSTTSGPPSATTGSTSTARRTAGRSRSTTCASTPTTSASRSWTARRRSTCRSWSGSPPTASTRSISCSRAAPRTPPASAAFPRLAARVVDAGRAARRRASTTNVVDPATGRARGRRTCSTIGPSLHDALLTGAAAAQLPLAIHLASEGRWDRASQLVPAVGERWRDRS